MLCALALAGCQSATIGDNPGVADSGSTSDSSASPDAPSIADASSPDTSLPDASLPDASLPDAPPRPCVEGDTQLVDTDTSHCYMAFYTGATWNAAQNTCASLDGHLVVITSSAENSVIGPLAGLLDLWTGGNDVQNEGTWVWLNGEPMSYTKWRAGEPNNSTNSDPDGENCMVYEGDNGGLWDDRPCGRTFGYICERSPDE